MILGNAESWSPLFLIGRGNIAMGQIRPVDGRSDFMFEPLKSKSCVIPGYHVADRHFNTYFFKTM